MTNMINIMKYAIKYNRDLLNKIYFVIKSHKETVPKASLREIHIINNLDVVCTESSSGTFTMN